MLLGSKSIYSFLVYPFPVFKMKVSPVSLKKPEHQALCETPQVKEWPLGPQGLLYDRAWMVVNENGICLSQKREPKLCLIHPVICLTTMTLCLKVSGQRNFVMSLLQF